MARTQIPTIFALHAGVGLTTMTADPTTGHYFTNDEKSVLVLVNLTGSDITATILANAYIDGDASSGLRVPNRIVVIHPGEQIMCGPFQTEIYNQADSTVYLDIDGPAQLVVASITGLGAMAA